MKNDDMTFWEINCVKNEIRVFVEKLGKIPCISEKNYTQLDKDFFAYLAKNIVFLKDIYLYSGVNPEDTRLLSVIISDIYNYIISVLQNEQRYIHLNKRSIIENYMRLSLIKNDKNSYFVSTMFDDFQKLYNDLLSNDVFSLLKNEYRESCSYVHGGELLNESLTLYLDNYFTKKKLKNRGNRYDNMKKILKAYSMIIIRKYIVSIDGVFHRRKTLLRYLLGGDVENFLFNERTRI